MKGDEFINIDGIRQAFTDGWSETDVSRKFRLGRHKLRRIMSEYGLSAPKDPEGCRKGDIQGKITWTAEERAQAFDMLKGGATIMEIATALHRPLQSIKQVVYSTHKLIFVEEKTLRERNEDFVKLLKGRVFENVRVRPIARKNPLLPDAAAGMYSSSMNYER